MTDGAKEQVCGGNLLSGLTNVNGWFFEAPYPDGSPKSGEFRAFAFSKSMALPQQEKPLGLDEVSRLYPVEVHSACEILTVKLHLVIPPVLFPILEKSDLLAEGVENGQLDS